MNSKDKYCDILSLDVKKIKHFLHPGKLIELAVSEDGVEFAQFDHLSNSWVLSIPNNISVTRDKIGRSLLKQHRNGFMLHDPHMYQSRFFVEYHRMQDPALKRYFNSAPVRKRLETLGVVTKQNNVLCSTKEFAEYLRYLEGLRALEVSDKMRNTQRKRLSDNLHKLIDAKQYESQFTGIFQHKRYKSERKPKADLTDERKKISLKQINSNLDQAVRRADKMKEEKRNGFKEKNLNQENKFYRNKLMFLQKEFKKKVELEKKIINKLQEAQQRKKHLQNEKHTAKLTNGVELFKKHWMLGEETRRKNIDLYAFYEDEKRRNIKKREDRFQRIYENDEIKTIQMKSEIARQKKLREMAEKVADKIQKLSKTYLKSVDAKDFEQISRRFSMVTEQYIAKFLKSIDVCLLDLKFPYLSSQWLERLLSFMVQFVIIRPEIGLTKCDLVLERVAGFIARTITKFKNERVKHIRDHRAKEEQIVKPGISTADVKKKHVTLADSVHEIHASPNSYEEFIDYYKSISRVKSEKFYDLNKFINVGAKWFCETVCKIELPYSDKLNHRDFIHLYDFQKVFIHRFIIRIMELVKIKQHHYWNVDRQISAWKELNLNLEGVSFEAANIIINYPCTNEEFCICIRNICKYICVQISQDLEEFEIGKDITTPEDDSGSDYEDLHQIL